MTTSAADPLPGNWTAFERAQVDRARAEHMHRELLAQLVREHAADGRATWETVRIPDPDEPTWTAYYLRPTDPSDRRPAIRITTFPKDMIDQGRALLPTRADHLREPPPRR